MANMPYILQNIDGRIVFVIPFESKYSLIGTTDLDYQGNPSEAVITKSETNYLCTVINRYFKKQINAENVVWSYSGVRPLFDDSTNSASAVTRDYVFDIDGGDDGSPPLLSIFGGKITTYRKLAEHAVNKLKPIIGFANGPWTRRKALPGGDISDASFETFLASVRNTYPWLGAELATRLARHYGTRIHKLLDGAQGTNDLGEEVAPGMYERELSYLVRNEWARTGQDILWRRSKMGLHMPKDSEEKIDHWIETMGQHLSSGIGADRSTSTTLDRQLRI